MVVVAQLVRALDCGSRGRRFETGLPPNKTPRETEGFFFIMISLQRVKCIILSEQKKNIQFYENCFIS